MRTDITGTTSRRPGNVVVSDTVVQLLPIAVAICLAGSWFCCLRDHRSRRHASHRAGKRVTAGHI